MCLSGRAQTLGLMPSTTKMEQNYLLFLIQKKKNNTFMTIPDPHSNFTLIEVN
jgi:hypothetical protein